MQCPECGSCFLEHEAPTDENINPKFGDNQQTRIITAKKKKKYYDKHGNLITDPVLIQDIERGATVYSYSEEKPD